MEVFFESQKRSFIVQSKNKIAFDETKQKNIKEFKIPKEYETDMQFTITIKNCLLRIFNDYQISNDFKESSKNKIYLKLFFNINNNNYIYISSKVRTIKFNHKIGIYTVNYFSII